MKYRKFIVLAWCLVWGCNPTFGAQRVKIAVHRFQGVEQGSSGTVIAYADWNSHGQAIPSFDAAPRGTEEILKEVT